MSKDFEIYSRTQSIGEEITNSVSHGVDLMGTIAALPILMVAAAKQGDTAGIVGASVFACNDDTAIFKLHALPCTTRL